MPEAAQSYPNLVPKLVPSGVMPTRSERDGIGCCSEDIMLTGDPGVLSPDTVSLCCVVTVGSVEELSAFY